tara:strand:+ start:549 stop:902 length:354 start_codon:yes stop_codon:yes gene_type:complete
MSSSGVALPNAATAATETVIIKPTSSLDAQGNGFSGTIYLWGVSYVAAHANAHAGTIIDDDDKEILTVVATENGPYFLQLSTPIQITQNSGLKFKNLSTASVSYITPFYVNSTLKGE